jgi:transglutaminase-like putative cysteine protease
VSRTYQVTHRTEYGYDDDVTASYGQAYMTPRDVTGQWCLSSRLEVEPAADLVTHTEDFYGNHAAYLEVHTPHRRLVVTSTSIVEVRRPPTDLGVVDALTWEQARDTLADWAGAQDGEFDAVLARGFLMSSPQVELSAQVRDYAAGIFRPGRPLGQAVADVVHRIFTDFAYKSGVTSVSTTLAEVLERREGVCQDFAQLAVACLRCAGLPARYVSGYLETHPPSDQPRLQGSDASHAWASVLLPELGWVDIDPTNDRLVDEAFIVTAWGRDYTDVPPLKGVIFTESTKRTLKVAVDVRRQ